MAKYRLTSFGVMREDGASIVGPSEDPDWVEYAAWLAAGGVPDPEMPFEAVQDAWLTALDQQYFEQQQQGFVSDATGTPGLYPSDTSSMLPVLASAISNTPLDIFCETPSAVAPSLRGDKGGKVKKDKKAKKEKKTHNKNQVAKVLAAWASYHSTLESQYQALRTAGIAATTPSELPTPVWTV